MMNVYMYQSELYCEECGKVICNQIINEGNAPENVHNESSYDSYDFPKGPLPNGGGEADSPQYCAGGSNCLDAIDLSVVVDGRKYAYWLGVFLENPLTEEGVKYVRELLRDAGKNVRESLRDTDKSVFEFYDIEIVTTEEKLVEMLKENTGRHLLDSGGAYGRNWEQNQKADFEKQPEGTIEFYNRKGELDIVLTLNVYHFLKERLDYNQELDDKYREYVEANGLYLDLNSAQLFVASIDGKGLHGENGPMTVNTYNNEDFLSQIIQYVYWSDADGDAHVLLQIHGGCDARGGYTDPVVFDCSDMDIFDNAHATIYCKGCGKWWDGDGYLSDGCGDRLQDYSAVDEKPEYPRPISSKQLNLPFDCPERPDIAIDSIWVDDDHNGHCPYCAGILSVAPYPCS